MVSPLPNAALRFVASVPSTYQEGVIACLDEDYLAPSFRKHPASTQATNMINYSMTPKHLSRTLCE